MKRQEKSSHKVIKTAEADGPYLERENLDGDPDFELNHQDLSSEPTF